ncbi:hypothetical protein DERF_013940 [Dermatophagoides farinae]|uniref:Uncharacterized protein n=1 Tax=Dermatophagoides farinae TaxID=6954 RepID=A0A922KZB1_DERFA|nr:hypothetical protein DERF_013940 [Dermatophagoides farinae]
MSCYSSARNLGVCVLKCFQLKTAKKRWLQLWNMMQQQPQQQKDVDTQKFISNINTTVEKLELA